MYYCEFCKQPIEKLRDGLVLKIRSGNGDFEKGLVLHKGDCDDKVAAFYSNQGKNTNGTMTLEILESLECVEKYRVTGELPQ